MYDILKTIADTETSPEGRERVRSYTKRVQDWHQFQMTTAPGAYAVDFVKRWVPPKFHSGVDKDEEKYKGEFFTVTYDENNQPILTHADDNDKKDASIVISVGMDASGTKYLKRSMEELRKLLPDTSKEKTLVYYYDSTLMQRAETVDSLMNNHYVIPDEVRTFAEIFTLDPSRQKLHIGYSYGGFFDRMTRNALAEKSKVTGVDYQKTMNTLVLGMFPTWGTSGTAKEDEKRHLSDYQESSSIFVVSVDDLIPYLPLHARSAILAAAKNHLTSPDGAPAPFMAYHHPHNKNKVAVILPPGITPSKVEDTLNFGGHNLKAYVEELHMREKNGIALGANTPLDTLRLAISSLMKHDKTGPTLADRLGAKKMDKEEIRAMDVMTQHYIQSAVARLLDERQHWVNKGNPDHPFTVER